MKTDTLILSSWRRKKKILDAKTIEKKLCELWDTIRQKIFTLWEY